MSTDQPKDVIGRPINVGDYVFSNNYLYEVNGITSKFLRGMLVNPSKSTKSKVLYSNHCCLVPKEEYLVYILSKE